jgi:phosphoribosylamine---glycine ligase
VCIICDSHANACTYFCNVKVLLLGSGGREHAYAHYLAASPLLTKLYIAPGNGGTASLGQNVNLSPTNFSDIHTFCIENEIDLILPGNEDPLVAGITDYFAEKSPKIKVAGPSKWCAQLEGSKSFSKKFMARHAIPTAAYKEITAHNLKDGEAFLDTLKAPYVLKADGLAAGKGVLIINDLAEAKRELRNMIQNDKFGAAGDKVVIEAFLKGIELSVFVVSDGQNWKILGSAKDYKRIGNGDTGLNTGGMGAISPVPFATPEFMQKVEEQVIIPTINGLRQEGHPYKGVLFIGLMNDGGNPYVVEYNVRMGDPETEAIFPRLQTDMCEMINAIASNSLNTVELSLNPYTAATVMLVSEGYPQEYEKGKVITIEPNEANMIFHAGTKHNGEELLTNGGRVIAVTALAPTLEQAQQKVYAALQKVYFQGKTYRTDIGNDLLET